ncbi:phage tail protein [Roseovarius confluentis]|uniref:phage tail protein n=1 Tax=Roseovarius confluentis TaxID=1852027 RepID=UPI000CDDE5D8|nr:tail fiber protein [Roseovarius confluentis]
MSEPFLGQIYLVGYNFAQRGFSFCAGQIIAISQNTALFSLLGNTFGGDGRTTFGLPDLRGRTAIGIGHGPGLPDYRWGEKAGNYQTTLNITNMPSHNHTATLHAETGPATQTSGSGNLLGVSQIYAPPGAAPNQPMASEAVTVANAGGNQPFNHMPPFLALNYEIAMMGIFPSRS